MSLLNFYVICHCDAPSWLKHLALIGCFLSSLSAVLRQFMFKTYCWGFRGGSVIKSLPANAGGVALIPEVPWRREWQPPPVFLPGKSHGQRSLVGCSLGNHKELDTTEHWMDVVIIKEMQIKTTMRQHLTPIKMATLKNKRTKTQINRKW